MKYDTSFLLTLHYVSFFMIGALLSKHRQFFHAVYVRLSTALKVSFSVIAILTYTFSWWFFHNIFFLHFQFIDDWVIVVGCSIFIIFCINSIKVKSIMLLKPIHFIGKISYSLYLIHVPVLLSLVNALYGKLPIGVILVGSFVVTYIAASIMYITIEKPSIKLGRLLTDLKSSEEGKKLVTISQFKQYFMRN